MQGRTRFALFALLVLSAISQAAEARGCKRPPPRRLSPPTQQPTTNITLTFFGDSLTDDGTNVFPASNYTTPDPTIYDKGRFSNGPVWAEFMKNLSNGQVGAVNNFAYGGAVACNENILPSDGYTIALALGNQTDTYLAGRKPLPAGVTNYNFIVIGSNDLPAVIEASNPVEAAGGIIRCIVDSVTKLAAAGETVIIVGNLPPIDRTPYIKDQGRVFAALASAVISSFNDALSLAISGLQGTLPNLTLEQLDINDLTDSNIDEAEAAGINIDVSCVTTVPPNQPPSLGSLNPNVTATECASGGEGFIWFDRIHPTTAVHKQFATQAAEQLRKWSLY